MTRASTLAILLFVAGAAPAQDPGGEERWVCVPTEDREWRCGRGADAPQPAPLPPAREPEPPPEGYQGPEAAEDVPYYLLDPTLPRPGDETARGEDAGETPGAGDAPREAVAEDAAPETGAAPTETPEATPPAEEAGVAPGPATPGPAQATERSAPDSVSGTGDARYAIQLAAARDPESLGAYRRELELKRLDVYQRAWEDAAGTWHVLLTGRFATASEASRALADLPERTRERGAWVRPLDTLQPASR